jgi:peptidyl-prolyl cis-trans isomerase B (cyclophilin B)
MPPPPLPSSVGARSVSVPVVLCLLLSGAPLAIGASPPWTAAGASADGAAGAQDGWVNSTARISTNYGTITVMLADLDAPITVGNFIELADTDFYDSMKWHRVVDDFVIQTGDPNSRDNNPYNDGMGGSTRTIQLEISENLTHVDGAIGMARSSDPDSASSQFYICDGEQHGLDGNYAVFGVTVGGIDVVRAIASVPVYGNRRPALSEHPVEDVWLYDVVIEPGHWNTTPPAPGPTDAVGDGGLFASGTGGGVATLLAIPLVIVVGAFTYFRRASLRRLLGRLRR